MSTHSAPPQLSVIVFAFNEAENIPAVLAELRAWLLANAPDSEVVFVDDGSSDGTAEAAAKALHGFPHRVVTHAKNSGIGAALKTGVRASRGEWVTFLPADGQIAPDAIATLMAARRDDTEVVFSVYADRDDGLHRKVLSWGVRTLIRGIHGVPMRSDGPYLFRRVLFDPEQLTPDSFFLNFEFPLRVVRAMDGVERNPSFVRSFAYGTGPALGLLLDRWLPGWHPRFLKGASMAALLREAVGESDASAVEHARPYGYAAVRAAEEERAQRRLATIARYRERLITGRRVVFPADNVNRSFDPNELVPLDSSGTIYPTGTFQGPWGTLTVTDGALLSADYRQLVVSAPDALAPTDGSARRVTGNGWTLDLGEGWVIALAPGVREGSFEVRRR